MEHFAVSKTTSESHRRWNNAATYTPEMRGLMDTVRAILTEGLHYTSDVLAAIIARSAFTSEDLALGKGQVEGGCLGMDVYYARDAVDREATRAREVDARAILQPTVGMKLGTLSRQFQLYRNVIIDAMDAEYLTLHGTRGNRRYSFQMRAPAVIQARRNQ